MRVESIIGEVQPAMPAIVRLILKLDLHCGLRRSALARPASLEEQSLGSIEGEVDRIERVDGREQRSFGSVASALHQIAWVDASVRNPPGDRRAHLGERDIERARLDARIGRRELGLRRLHFRAKLVHIALRHRQVLQPKAPPVIGLGDCKVAARSLCRRSGLIQCGDERPRVDREQQLSLMDDRTVRKMERNDRAGNARAYLDALARFEAARIIVPFLHLTHERAGDRYRHGRGCGGSGRAPGFEPHNSGQQRQRQSSERNLLRSRQPRHNAPQSRTSTIAGFKPGFHVHRAALRRSAARLVRAWPMLFWTSWYWSCVKPAARKSRSSELGTFQR